MTSSSAGARRAKEITWALVEALWAAAFRTAGRLRRSAVAWWSSPGRQRVLVIAPHPDDEAVGCAGTIIRHKQCHDVVCVACITDGRQSRARGLGPEAMAYRRRQEAEACARVLGIDHLEWFGLPEGAWATAQLQPRLGALVQQWAPDLIYAPSRVDFHPEHLQVAAAVATLLSGPGAGHAAPPVRIYQIQVPLTPILTNLVADTSGVASASVAALKAHTSQWGSTARTLRSRRYAARWYGCACQAEEFWELSAVQYRLLHGNASAAWPGGRFWSLRARPLSDPLAYLRGLAARRRLAALTRGGW